MSVNYPQFMALVKTPSACRAQCGDAQLAQRARATGPGPAERENYIRNAPDTAA